MAINFPLRTAFGVPKVLIVCIFILIKFQELFDYLTYFFDDSLIMEQFVEYFLLFCYWVLFYCVVVRKYGRVYFNILMFAKTYFWT
jgi:hypothetical protein